MLRSMLAVAVFGSGLFVQSAVSADDALAEPIRKGREYLLRSLESEKAVGKRAIAVVAIQSSIPTGDAKRAQEPRIVATIAELDRVAEKSPADLETGNESHYALSYSIVALVNDGLPKHQRAVGSLVRLLESRQLDCGGWAYPNGAQADTSQTYHVLMALSKAATSGVKVSRAVWEKGMLFHLRTQDGKGPNGAGGFAYHPSIPKGEGRADQAETATMSIAGYCSMLICRRHIEARKPAEAAPLAGGGTITTEQMQRAIDDAEQWVMRTNPYSGTYNAAGRIYYYLAELERSAALRGKGSPFDKVAWHQAGAERILLKQRDNGSFKGGEYDSADTALAVMFLAHAAANENAPRVAKAVAPAAGPARTVAADSSGRK